MSKKSEKIGSRSNKSLAGIVFGALQNDGFVPSLAGSGQITDTTQDTEAQATHKMRERGKNVLLNPMLKVTYDDVIQALKDATPEWKRKEHQGRLKGYGNAVEDSDPTNKFLNGHNEEKHRKNLALYTGYSPDKLTPKMIQYCVKLASKLLRKQSSGKALTKEEKRALDIARPVAEYEELGHSLSIDSGLVAARRSERPPRSNFDSENMERLVLILSVQENWFGDNFATAATTSPDDEFNGIDIQCAGLIGNQPFVFGIDFTCQPDPEKIHKKMQRRHLGEEDTEKVNRARKDPKIGLDGTRITPPGDPPRPGEEDYEYKKGIYNGKRFSHYALKDKFRKGLRFLGFSRLNYAWCNEVEDDRRFPKGDIPVVERFVVGVSSDILQILISPPPNQEDEEYVGKPEKYKNDMTHFRQGQELAKNILKWSTLLECRKQAQDIATMLNQLSPNEVRRLKSEYPQEFRQAKESSARAVKFFNSKIEDMKRKTGVVEHPPEARITQNQTFYLQNPEQVAYECAIRDDEFQKICRESYESYIYFGGR